MPSPVLFVDDSAVARHAGEKRLRAAGLDVRAIGSTKEAATVDAGGLSAALLDLELGDGLGTDLAETLRARQPGLPIAFLTGSTSTSALDVAQRFGPVFAKAEVDAAVQWIAQAAAKHR